MKGLAAARDESAGDPLEELFTSQQARLFRLARRLCASHEAASDLVQQTFVRVLASASRLPPHRDGQEAWLVTTMVNLARDQRRRQAVAVRFSPVSALPAEAFPDPENAYLARIAVDRALGELDARRRAIVVLHYLEGKAVTQVAALLGISAITVRWHLARARKQLAASLCAGR